jgi:uncharacterized protein (UPF0261 family)
VGIGRNTCKSLAQGIELTSGLATALVETVGIGAFLFVPFPSGSESPNLGTASPSVTAMQQGLSPLAVVILSTAAAACVGVATGAMLHILRKPEIGWRLLLGSALVLFLSVVASNEGGVVFLGPGMLVALMGVCAGWRVHKNFAIS